jgi:crotonobetainyl-CoA:carnitine CoA-transferase CaiB-like acyl-CoA transferase
MEIDGAMSILKGNVVLDLSEVYQAPLAAQVLGDFGATVIKIERPETGEILRNYDSHATARGLMSSYFASVNRNKKSLVVDLKTEAGRALVTRLAKTADVLIHNYRPGVMERLGLGYEQLSGANPRLIYAESSGYGATGPLSQNPGQDMAIQSLTGIAVGNSLPDGTPALVNTPIVDFASGMVLAQGVVLALLERERSGQGQKVSTCLLDTAIAMQSLEAASQLMYGYETRWIDKGLNFVFRTSDGWITVLGFFRANPLALLCNALGINDLSTREDLNTPQQQLGRKTEIYELLREDFLRFTTADCLARLVAQDILCSPLLPLEQALDHPQVRHNGMVISVPIEGLGTVEVVGNPLKLSRTPPTVQHGPPALGAHTRETLEAAGFTEEEIAAYAANGAFGRPEIAAQRS